MSELKEKVTRKQPIIKPSYVVGIGSSAGGLNALEEFFDNCPVDTGFAFVIIQHLSPDYKSLMPELLSRHTTMSVKEAKEGDLLQANHVYLIPAIKNIQVKKGKLELTKRPPNNQVNFSIDIFFNSLAVDQKEKSLAIVLSGTGSDGTKGSKAIKEIGGTIFVQSPESSDFDGMPKSVISQGLADYILEPNEMATELVDYLSDPGYMLPVPTSGDANNHESLNRILRIIQKHIGFDFFSYKKPTLLRRTAKRINITKSKNIENYIEFLYENPQEKHLLAGEFLIGVTKFFRDYKAFDILKSQVIPSMVASKRDGENLKIWVVACSTGEEAYSIAILIEEHLRQINKELDYKVFATDIDERGIDVATKGAYNENIESEVSPEILAKYFIKKENRYQILPSIRKRIIFSKHDILQNPPFNKMDLVTCRNMLIYMENTIQTKVLSSLHFSLNVNGFLFLGSSENLGELSRNFKEVNNKWKIYQNIQADRLYNLTANNSWRVNRNSPIDLSSSLNTSTLDEKIAKSINKSLMDNMNAVSVCVNDNYDIIHATGNFSKYIQYPTEGFTNNLLRILPDELNIPIGAAIRKIAKMPNEKVEKTIKLLKGDDLLQIRLLISNFTIVSLNRNSFLITIVEDFSKEITGIDEVALASASSNSSEQVNELKDALRETKENLYSSIEKLETSNEEMQAANEELQSLNEELQSTNEELQSLNEELHTVNAELQEKNTQLIELNSDMENLMRNINIGTIFLDKDFKIRKFTDAISDHFNLRLEDLGRSISHFSGTISGKDVIQRSKEVIATLVPHSQELQNSNGNWFLMQIFPYRSGEDVIKGVVINFINVSDIKEAIEEKENLNSFLTHLVNSNPAAVYIYNIIERVNEYVNANIFDVAGYSEDDIKELGDNLMPTIIVPEDFENVVKHHEAIRLLKDGEVAQLEYRVRHKNTGQHIWMISSDKVHSRTKDGQVETILGTTQVITEFKEMELQVKSSEERLRLAINATRSGLWEWPDVAQDEAWFSNKFYQLLGYSSEDISFTFSSFLKLIHPDQVSRFTNELKNYSELGKVFELEVQIKTNDKGYRWFRINGKILVYDQEDGVRKIVGTLVDINNKKESQNKLLALNSELERFAYLASHDLKEPLRTVTSFTQLFKEEYAHQFDEDAMTYLNFIEKASSRMITLTNDLLAYSQLDDKSLNFQNVNLNDILSNIKEDLYKTIAENEAEITINKLPNLICDSLQIRLLFQNLISNSLKYRSDRNPVVEVGAISTPQSTQFFVKDNGIGIAKNDHGVIFKVFKRLHSNSEYEGTGIGLANCQRIINNHNGKIWVESELGEGTIIYFSIPTNLK